MDSDTYALEFEYRNKSQICVVDYDTAWIDISALIQISLDVQDIDVKYVDDENDEISLNSEDELTEAKKLAHQSGNVVKFTVYDKLPGSKAQTKIKKIKPQRPPPPKSKHDPVTGCVISEDFTMDSVETNNSLATINVSAEMLEQFNKPPEKFVDKVVHEILQGLDGCLLVAEDTDNPCVTQNNAKDEMPEDKASNIEWSTTASAGHPTPSNEFVDKIVEGVLSGLNESEIRSAIVASGRECGYPNGPAGQVHSGVICDRCNKTIIGTRFKCGHCSDFDLCKTCEVDDWEHDKNHVFLKIRWPAISGLGTTFEGKPIPLLSVPFYPTDEGLAFWEQRKLKHVQKLARRFAKAEYKFRYKEEKRKRKEMGIMQMSRTKREKLETSSETDQRDGPRSNECESSTAEKLNYWTKYVNATFVGDVNFPQGTHLQPGTKFTKSWNVLNVGSVEWNNDTTLKFLWGNIPNISDDPVQVPHLLPGQQGVVSVECEAPRYPGNYESHWRLCQDCEQFGQRVWCNIVVDLAEILEPNEDKTPSLRDEFLIAMTSSDSEACNAVANLQPDQSDSNAPNKLISSNSELLTAQDILSFEMLKISSAKEEQTPVDEGENDVEEEVEAASKFTSTPNNTPCGMTPCMSPVPQLDVESLSTKMSNHGGLKDRIEDTKIEELEEKAAVGRPCPSKEDEDMDMVIVDKDNAVSGGPSDSSDDDLLGDFCVVPLPDCFDLTKPLDECVMSSSCGSQSVFSTSGTPETPNPVLLDRGTQPDIDVMLATSHSLIQSPLIPLVAATKIQPELEEPAQGSVALNGCTITAPEIVLEMVVATEDPGECGFIVTPEDDAVLIAESRSATDLLEEMEDDSQDERQTEEQSELKEPSELLIRHRIPVIPELDQESDLEGGDIFHDAEDNSKVTTRKVDNSTGQDVPQQSEIPRDTEPTLCGNDEIDEEAGSRAAPEQSNLKLYRLPDQRQDAAEILEYATSRAAEIASNMFKQTYAAANVAVSSFLSPETSSPPSPSSMDSSRSPMDTLLEMGFGNRDKNRELLYKYNNDVNQCVQDLLSNEVDNWHLTRH